ncbi:hypothetical protein OAU99_01555 [Candidatus Poseidoniaceae archaeon]|nr:hypothetical protein [Candidatus Poseidoniaceae archaeon]
MSNELRIIVYDELKRRRQIQTDKEIARDFIRNNAYRTDSYGSLKLVEEIGWIVLTLPNDARPIREIDFEKFVEYEDAYDYAKQLYPNASEDWLKEVCYNGIIGFKPYSKTGLLEDGLEQILAENEDRILKKIRSFLETHSNPDVLSNINYPSPDDAIADFDAYVKLNINQRGKQIRKLTSDNKGDESWFILDQKQWSTEKRVSGKPAPPYPKIPKSILEVKNPGWDDLGFLTHFYEYLFKQDEISIAEALALGHREIYSNYEGAKAKRSALNGKDVISISQDSGFRDTILAMAKKGFTMQPIIDNNQKCIGAIQLQDVIRIISENGVDSLPDNFDVKVLNEMNLLMHSPPILDARAPVSEAERILKSGNDGILIRFEPGTWFGDCPSIVSETLNEGLHIITSFDIAAYHLSNN